MNTATPFPAPLVRSRADTTLRLGYLPLTDAAPFLVAQARGLFRQHGVKVELSCHHAWAALRDRIACAGLDGAQMLAPMPLALSLGLGGPQRAVSVLATLSRNGNTVVLSRGLIAHIREAGVPAGAPGRLEAAALAAGLARRAQAGLKPPVFAVVFAFSAQAYLLRHWLTSAGIVPERDVRLVVLPPSQVGESLASGMIDGFCAGEPWGSRAVDLGVGEIALTTGAIWPDHPEKVLAFAADGDVEAAIAATAALIEAGRWVDDPANHDETVRLLCRHALPKVPPELVGMILSGGLICETGETVVPVEKMRFAAGSSSYPSAQEGAWYLGQMRRWGHLPPGGDEAVDPWRPQLWARAAARLGIAVPADASWWAEAHPTPHPSSAMPASAAEPDA